MARTATQFITWTYQQPFKPVNLKPHAKKDKTAAEDLTDTSNEFIWALARKYTNSAEEARAAVEEMQADINQCAEKGERATTNKDLLIARIARQLLKKFLT